MVVRRDPPTSPIRDYHAGMGVEVIEKYQGWVERFCGPGTDTDTFGETVTTDVEALLNIFERINQGKLVAEFKYQQQPEAFIESGGDTAVIRSLVVREDREQVVLESASQVARHYDLDPEPVLDVFQWMIKKTVAMEVGYIRNRIDG